MRRLLTPLGRLASPSLTATSYAMMLLRQATRSIVVAQQMAADLYQASRSDTLHPKEREYLQQRAACHASRARRMMGI